MKRITNVWNTFVSEDNCRKAILDAARNKKRNKAVKRIIDAESLDVYVQRLSRMLDEGNFHPTPIVTRKVKTEYGKERDIASAPFFPDCCVAHAIANVMRPRWTKAFTDDSYACIPLRGINASTRRWSMNRKVKRVMCKYRNKPLYALFLDISKCYQSVDNEKLYMLNRKYCKEGRLLDVIHEMIFNCEGLAIGLYFSQLQINIILTEVDRFIKQTLGVKYYFRYMDDMMLFAEDKHMLHTWQWRIMNFLWYELHFSTNNKRQVFPVGRFKRQRAPDFGGYVYKKRHTAVRKRVKKAFIKRRHSNKSVVAYMGILMHCDAHYLIYKVLDNDNTMKSLSELGIKIERPFEGERIAIEAVVDKEITLCDFDVRESKKKDNSYYVKMQVIYEGRKRFIGGGYQYLASVLLQVDHSVLPLLTIIREDKGYYFDGTIIK